MLRLSSDFVGRAFSVTRDARMHVLHARHIDVGTIAIQVRCWYRTVGQACHYFNV